PVEIRGHARAGGVVVGRKLEIVRVVFGARVVLFRLIERAEAHVLHDMEAERLLAGDRFPDAVHLGPDFVVACGPELFPAQYFGILEQEAPKRHEIAIHGTPILGGGVKKLIELAISSLSRFDRDIPLARLRPAMLAEAGNAGSAPRAADQVLKRTHP